MEVARDCASPASEKPRDWRSLPSRATVHSHCVAVASIASTVPAPSSGARRRSDTTPSARIATRAAVVAPTRASASAMRGRGAAARSTVLRPSERSTCMKSPAVSTPSIA
jgi:hypothetical protein